MIVGSRRESWLYLYTIVENGWVLNDCCIVEDSGVADECCYGVFFRFVCSSACKSWLGSIDNRRWGLGECFFGNIFGGSGFGGSRFRGSRFGRRSSTYIRRVSIKVSKGATR